MNETVATSAEKLRDANEYLQDLQESLRDSAEQQVRWMLIFQLFWTVKCGSRLPISLLCECGLMGESKIETDAANSGAYSVG